MHDLALNLFKITVQNTNCAKRLQDLYEQGFWGGFRIDRNRSILNRGGQVLARHMAGFIPSLPAYPRMNIREFGAAKIAEKDKYKRHNNKRGADMSIEFIEWFDEDFQVTHPVFPSPHSDLWKLDDRIAELLEMSCEHYTDGRNIKVNFACTWGYVKVSAQTMGELGFGYEEFICQVPYVKDDGFTLPNVKGKQIQITGWEAGLAVMNIAFEEYATFCVYAAAILEDAKKEDIIRELKLVIGDIEIETAIKNAGINSEIIIQIGCELNLLKMFQVID